MDGGWGRCWDKVLHLIVQRSCAHGVPQLNILYNLNDDHQHNKKDKKLESKMRFRLCRTSTTSEKCGKKGHRKAIVRL